VVRRRDCSFNQSKITKKNQSIEGTVVKFTLEAEKEKIRKMNEALKKAKEEKIKEAKDLKEKNRLIRENICLFKERILYLN
jgi:hypothetical protein